MIAHSIAYDGDLDLTNNYPEAQLIGAGAVTPEAHAIARNGRLLPVHDIGMPLLLAPFVWVAHQHAGQIHRELPTAFKEATKLNEALVFRHVISLVMAMLTGWLAAEMFKVLRLFGASSHAAFSLALLFALTPPVLSHAFLFFTEIPTALIVLYLFRRIRLQRIDSSILAVALGVLAGYLLLIHIRYVGIVAGLIVIAILRGRNRALTPRVVGLFLAGTATVALARTALTYRLWGTYVSTPHSTPALPASMTTMVSETLERITGLLFDRDFGLIAYSPIYLLAGSGVMLLWRQRPRLARDIGLVLACYLIPVLLPITNTHGWRGGFSPAARMLVPILPLVWIGVYEFWAQSSRTGRAITNTLIAIQIAMIAFVWQNPKTLWKDEDGSIFFPGSLWLPAWTDPGATLWFAALVAIACAWTIVCVRYFAKPTPGTALADA